MLKLKLFSIIFALTLLAGCAKEKEPDLSSLACEIVKHRYSLNYVTHNALVSTVGIEQLSQYTVNTCSPFLICVPQGTNSAEQVLTCWGFIDISGETEFGSFEETVYIQFDTNKDVTVLENVKIGDVCDFFESFPGGVR